MTPERAAALLALVSDWLKRMEAAGYPPPGEYVRQAVLELAHEAPAAAMNRHRIRRLLGPRATHELSALATAPHASAPTPRESARADWLTVAEAARELGLRPDSVRWLLRKGQLPGKRAEWGWLVEARAVRARTASNGHARAAR